MANPLLFGFLTVFKKVASKVIEHAKKDHQKTCHCDEETEQTQETVEELPKSKKKRTKKRKR